MHAICGFKKGVDGSISTEELQSTSWLGTHNDLVDDTFPTVTIRLESHDCSLFASLQKHT